MKKVLLVLFFAVCYLPAFSQIQRIFFGQTLGVSTKEEVYNALKSKGASCTTISGEEVVFLEDVRFGGFSWGGISFFFYNNIFSYVVFVESRDLRMNIEWQNITERLDSKYHNFLSSKNENKIVFSDEATMLTIGRRDDNIGMTYGDLKTIQEKKIKERDEL